MSLPKLYLKKEEDRRIRSGHLWIYSNEVAVDRTPLKGMPAGQLVQVHAHNSNSLGVAYVNPNSLICGRLLTSDAHLTIDQHFFVERLQQALQLRTQWFAKPYYRLVFGESDLLPGLIIDRFADDYVVQLNTAGLEALQEIILAAMEIVLKPNSILLRNDSSRRELEGLEKYVRAASGNPPTTIKLEENNCHFIADIWQGQKTGWFYDHRLNRAMLQHYVKDKKVLDVFSYTGAFAIPAAVYGASQVSCVDSSATAIELLKENARLNQVEQKINCIQTDAFDALNKLLNEQHKFDLIILDPPAFIKRKKDIPAGTIAYQRINELALKLLNKHGVLLSASCSMHLQRADLLSVLRKASYKTEHTLQIIEQAHQGPDHPIHAIIDETEYLKGFMVRKIS